MSGCRNRKCVRRRADFSPRAQREQKALLERARRIGELFLDYVPNDLFQAWILDKETENKVLGPVTASNAPMDDAPLSSSVWPYMVSLYKVPLLTREQEVHLFRKMNYLKYKASRLREGLDPARPQKTRMAQIEKLYEEIIATKNRIICANLRLVVSIAKRHVKPAQDIFDLVSDGNISLMHAVEHFDYSFGNKFSTYAAWAIINNFSRTILASLRQQDRFRTDHADLFTAMPDIRSSQHELEAVQSHRKKLLDSILRRLANREREIIASRFGLRYGEEPQTLQQVGDTLGISKERIRQIEGLALVKLRKVLLQEGLTGALEPHLEEERLLAAVSASADKH